TQKEELTKGPTERAIAANLFFSFGTVDDHGNVTLQPQDLRRMLRSMGVVVSEEKLTSMVCLADKNFDGQICEDEFLAAFDWLVEQGQDERDYMAIFNMLDNNKDGRVDAEELANLHTTTKERLTLEEARKIVMAADKNGDGAMNYREFVELMTNNKVRWAGG
ncbi:unnamed protein product, partial [Choristocarpus tenellus]